MAQDYLITPQYTLALTPIKNDTKTWQVTPVDKLGKLAKSPELFYINFEALTAPRGAGSGAPGAREPTAA